MTPERPAILASVQGDYGGGRVESEQGGIVLRTGRLSLLPLTGLDEAEHARASRNAEDALRDTRAAEPQWQEHGFGPWAIRDKRDDSFLGCAELRFAGEGIEGIAADEVEAGWWVTEERRNEGIATEAMEAAIDDLWSRTDVQTIAAYIEDGQNEPSRRVAAKLGFAVRSTGRGRSGEPMTVYTLCRDDWLRRLSSVRWRLAWASVHPPDQSRSVLTRHATHRGRARRAMIQGRARWHLSGGTLVNSLRQLEPVNGGV